MDSFSLSESLAGLPLGGLKFYQSTGSTNDIAMDWAENGAADFSLVVADHQSAGRGRMKRKWVTAPGSALAFSLILRPEMAETARFGLFSPLGAMAVCDALADSFELQAEIKWPNDVLLRRRKICGILSEVVWLGDKPVAMVVGIGVNVAPLSVPPPEDVLFPADCIENVFGGPVDRERLLRSILDAFANRRKSLTTPQFLSDWEQRLAFMGEPVSLQSTGRDPFIATVAGIAPDGNLRVRDQNGTIQEIAAGEIHLRPLKTT